MEQLSYIADYTGYFGDIRLERRGQRLCDNLSFAPCSSIRKLSLNYAEQKAQYRFLNNERVKESTLISELAHRASKLCSGRHVLCIQDSSEVNLSKHKGRLHPNSGLGRSDNSESANCFKLHPGLVLDSTSLNPLGFSHIKVFHRPEEMPDKKKRKYPYQPIEDKESYKWIEVAQRSKEVLTNALSITFIEDREGDIYEQFALIPDEKCHLLVRSRTTRKLSNGKDLYSEVGLNAPSGIYEIEIPTDRRKNQYKRTAVVELRFAKCFIKCPDNLKSKGYPPDIAVNCIIVNEINGTTDNPVSWKLLTTHQIDTFEQALLMVDWYCARWYIEQIFRLLKTKGFGIEETELESGWAIRKLAIMQLSAMLKILQMNIAYTVPEGGQPIEEVFSPEEIIALHLVNNKIQGKTKKQQNLNDPKTTKWAAWIIGRLGGWKGYDSQGPPGVIVLKRGMERLQYIIEGVNLVKDVYTQ